mmetsp:Transcript_100506/g.267165  ORF Transcript_100506/g.267165 Transcript_100506/m.267165 type:complete len:195 (-) Transcript_100506:93-677(-)|eukprot:CAMPEP_0171168258 /NCGR_PEP_ID=MMETSP0790-20130122/7618_1 /TAXON_ID=2925 /ORGANISM="Alexandrium catenella, Strain OF101" /LENGTH=194 /DNA_ID=CAMNT_0011633093 /DNA_START=39 /DNA_END=623 /DNA_ORIENTATION=+
MALGRRTRAIGRLAVGCGAAMWLLAATTFVTPGGQRAAGLRGSQGGSAAEYRPFSSHQAVSAEPATEWRTLAGIAAGFGFAAAVLTTPTAVLAQDEVVEGERVADPAAPARQRKRASRPKVKKEEKSEQEFKLPSFSVPDEAPVKQKVIISPADELDDDEKPLGAANWPLAALIFFGPSAIYTTFWVLGSLDII